MKTGPVGQRSRGGGVTQRPSAAARPAVDLRAPPAHLANLNAPMLMRMQAGAGNQATATLLRNHLGSSAQRHVEGRVVQRRAGGGSLPAPPLHTTPASDPAFRAMTTKLARSSKAVKKHPPARVEAKNASQAAQPPSNDVGSQAKAAQVDAMGAAKVAGFDKTKFVAAVKEAIERKAPKNLEQADEFGKSGKAGEVKADVQSRVSEGKKASEKDIKGKAEATPDPSKATPKPVSALSPPLPTPQLGDPGSAAAMPRPAPAEQTDLSTGGDETKSQMAEADVSEGQLAKSNEPEFQAAAAAKGEATQHSNQAPAGVRAAEKEQLTAARGGASSSAKGALSMMLGKKTGNAAGAHQSKAGAKAKEEAERSKVAADIEQIYTTTKLDTEKILSDLDGRVTKTFDAGEKDARQAFETSYSKQMTAYKDQRYSGLLGKGRWLKDKLTSMPSEVNQFFVSAKAIYVERMDQVISNVADIVGGELTRARYRIGQGRTEIKNYVSQQKGNLAKYAKESEQNIAGKFDDLDKSVDEKQDGLVDDLASKYVEARSAVDARIEELQSENKGLWEKAKDMVGGVIKTILQLKDMLLSVLARAANAVMKIIKDPIGFLGHLISGVKAGLGQFLGNIWTHLKKGVVGWLLGALASTGIELPENFDLKGILKLMASIIGLTWENFKTRLVKKVGAPVAEKISRGVDFVKAIATGGLGAAWTWIVDKVGDIKDTILNQVKDFLANSVIAAGIEWIMGLLSPAGAFIKACKLIYSVVMFFVERASQIKEFVDSVLDSVESIAGGVISKVSNAIEQSLAKILPLAIGFLASLLGLGGIAEKIQSILKTVQKPVTKAFDFLIGKAVKMGKGMLRKIKNSKIGKKVAAAKAKAKAKIAAGKAYVKGKVAAGKAWAKKRMGRGKNAQPQGGVSLTDAKSKATALLAAGGTHSVVQSGLAKLKSQAKLSCAVLKHGKGKNRYKIVLQRTTAATPEATLLPDPLPAHRYLPKVFRGKDVMRDQFYIRDSGFKGLRKIVFADMMDLLDTVVDMVKMGPEYRDEVEATIDMNIAAGKLPVSARKALKAGRLDAAWVRAEIRKKRAEFAVDHAASLAEHWVRKGHDSDDKTRRGLAGSVENLDVLTKKANLSKGSVGAGGKRYHYSDVRYVGLSFQNDLVSDEGRVIKGEPFYRDEALTQPV